MSNRYTVTEIDYSKYRVVFCSVCRAGNFWNAVFGFASTDWLLGSRKLEIPSAGREPQMLCISLSSISGNSVSLRETE